MKPVRLKIAIPRFGDYVAPCLGAAATLGIFTVEQDEVIEQTSFPLESDRALDRVRLLRDQGVDVLICGGIQDRIEDIIRASGIRVHSWVSGTVEDLIVSFLRGELESPSGDPTGEIDAAPEPNTHGRCS